MTLPVAGSSPYKVPSCQPADQIRPPASIGGPAAPEVTLQPASGENVFACAFSESAHIPSLQVT